MHKVSVIIATYNRARLLPAAVESAKRAGTDVEIIVVDDASTDSTPEVCASLTGVRCIRLQTNQRLGGARNIGIMASSGEYVTFLDDDDVRIPGSLDLQARALDAAPAAGLVYGRTVMLEQSGVTGLTYPDQCPEGDIFWLLLERNFTGCPAVVFRRSCLERVGLPTTTLPGVEDWDLWIRIAELYPAIAVREPVVLYRRATPGSGQFTSDAAGMARRITTAHATRWMKLPRVLSSPSSRQRTVRRALSLNVATQLLWESARAIRYGRFTSATASVVAALQLHPWSVVRRLMDPTTYVRLSRLVFRTVSSWRANRGEEPTPTSSSPT